MVGGWERLGEARSSASHGPAREYCVGPASPAEEEEEDEDDELEQDKCVEP